MPVRSVTHSDWQVLRAATRSKKPPTGRALRIWPTGRTRDGSFLVRLVERGLLAFVTGGATAPLEATYALTESGRHAAEYGEYEYEWARPSAVPPAVSTVAPVPGRKPKKT